MWGPVGQQVMLGTPHRPYKRYGLGAVNYHTGQTLVLVRQHKRRVEVAELLQALLDKHPAQTIYITGNHCSTHQDADIESLIRGTAGRLGLLYLPTYSPWLNPIEMLWPHFRREVTHCELFESLTALVEATLDFFARYIICLLASFLSLVLIPTNLSGCT